MNANSLNLAEMLQYRAQHSPEKIAYTHLGDGENATARSSYHELDRRARAVASALRSRDATGRRVLLLFAPGLDFVAALFGCFYAGAVAVPAYPPDPLRLERTLPRLMAIVRDSAPALVLTSSDLQRMASAMFNATPELSGLEWLAVDTLPAATTTAVPVNPDDLAFIQYTSGSTATPKGVMVSHGNALASLRMVSERTEHGQTGVIACWVPFYHDMGLVTGILLPTYTGGSVVLMSPLDFFQRPVRWLEAIQKYQVTGTSAPNFALDLCVDRIPPEQRRSLDLRSLEVLVISAEPVRPSSLRRFREAFAPAGLSPTCILPAYGLAEAVLALTCAPPGTSLSPTHIHADDLQHGRWLEVAPEHARARALVPCGSPMPEVRLEIVDPERRTRCAPGQIGEIWALGPSVALGYWNRPDETHELFSAQLEGTGEGPFLRTGDLGYLKDGELYVTGRIKDLIIIRGKNHYPQDIEGTAERAHPAVRAGCVIAFSVDVAGAEQLVVVAEIDRSRLRPDDAATLEGVAQAIRLSVLADHGVQVQRAALIKPRTIDKTSSGKLARRACRQRFLDGRLETELPRQTGPAEPPSVGPAPVDKQRTRNELLTNYVKQRLTQILGADAERAVNSGGPVGLDSLAVLELIGRIDKDLGVKLPMAALREGVSVAWLVDYLLEREAAELAPVTTRPAPSGRLVVALQRPLLRRPFFCVTGTLGIALHLRGLAQALGQDQPFYALQAPGLDGQEAPLRTVEALAQRYLEDIRHVQPRGPYVIGGYSFGGLVAFELAQRLTALGEQVSRLVLLDSITVAPDDRPPPRVSPHADAYELLAVLRSGRDVGPSGHPHTAEDLAQMSAAQRQDLLLRELAAAGGSAQEPLLRRILGVHMASMEAMRSYRPRAYQGPVTLVRAEGGLSAGLVHPSRELRMQNHDPLLGWGSHCSDLRVIPARGDHLTMSMPPFVRELGATVRAELEGSGHIEVEVAVTPAGGSESPRPAPSVSSTPRADAASLFNPFHPDYIADPYPTLHRLRAEDPVHWSSLSIWCISRYKDVVAGLRDKRFSVDSRRWIDPSGRHRGSGDGRSSLSAWSGSSRDENSPQARIYNNAMVTLDPPRHTRLRKLLSPVFEPSAMKRWRGYVQEIVDSLLRQAMARSEIDLIRDLALPLPSLLISALLGLPREDVPMLRRWSSDLLLAFDPLITSDVLRRAEQVAGEFEAYMRSHVESTRSAPKGELLALMLAAEAEGERLTTDELIAHCIFLFMAGFESTTGVIGNGVLALLRNPDQMRLLHDQPDLIEGAVEELLRYDGSVRHVFRTAVEDIDMGGKLIRSGDSALFLLPAANRDPAEFPDPDRLDLTRKGRHHVAFGHGIHYCIGAPLTRLEIQIAIQSAIRAMPRMKLVPDGLRWRPSISMRMLDSLVLTPE